jgi:hypothetical protein
MWVPLALIATGVALACAPKLQRSRRRARARSSAWLRWASARGYEFRRYDGSFQRQAGECVRGSHHGIPFELRLVQDGAQDDARLVTRLQTRGRTPASEPLDLYTRETVAEFQRAVLRSWIEFPAGAFQERWLVRGKRADEAHELIGPSTQQRLLACDRVTRVHVASDRVELTFDGPIEDGAQLDRGVEAVCGFFAELRAQRAAG